MGIWDRLESVFKSYVNDFGGGKKIHDSDLDAAYEELDDYLNKDKNEKSGSQASQTDQPTGSRKTEGRPIPKELYNDLEELGLAHDASFEECKAAYKELLKKHHPDIHSKHENNMKKATEKSARINASYKRLENWYKLANSK